MESEKDDEETEFDQKLVQSVQRNKLDMQKQLEEYKEEVEKTREQEGEREELKLKVD